MSSKQLLFDDAARQALLKGVQQLARAVAATLGPKGRNVAIDRKFGSPLITKDGVTVAKEITLQDPFENMGAQMVKEVASKTADMAGDGTTTATVLAAAIYGDGLESVTKGASPIGIQRGIAKAVAAATAQLKTISTPVQDTEAIRQVATVSANWDTEIGGIIAEAMDKVGKDGTITVEEGRGVETTLEVVEGMQFNKGYVSPYFLNATGGTELKFENTLVLINEKKLSNAADLVPVLQKVAKEGKPLLIIAEDFADEVIAMLVVNHVRGGLKVCAVKAPGFGDKRKDILGDIAALTGGDVVSDEVGLSLAEVTTDNLGLAKSIIIGRDSTTIVEGAGDSDDINKRIESLRAQIAEATSDFDREKLQERLGKLAGGVGVINVGATTESEMKEKKARVEDALHATRAAVEEGIVPGGGTALIRCIAAIEAVVGANEDEELGIAIVLRAVEAPLRQLVLNAGVDASSIIVAVKGYSGNQGYNVATGQHEDLVKAGVVDPTKVTRSALQNAASIAALLLTTECLITDVPGQDKDEKGAR